MLTRFRFTGALLLAAVPILLLALAGTTMIPRQAATREQWAPASALGSAPRQAAAAPTEPPAAVPPLVIPGDEAYAERQPGETITAPDGRPVAQLDNPSADVARSVSVNLPENTPVPAGDFGFQVLSSIRYSGTSGNLLVSTSRASAAAQGGYSLGGKQVQLPSGGAAWFSDGIPGEYPSQVVWEHDGVIVTVASDLAPDQLMGLLNKVKVVR